MNSKSGPFGPSPNRTSTADGLPPVAGGASGGDILFHEVCGELGVPTRLYLALPPESYVTESVAPRRFSMLLLSAFALVLYLNRMVAAASMPCRDTLLLSRGTAGAAHMQDMHAEEHYAVEVELPGGQRVLVTVSFPTSANGKAQVRVLGPGGRLLKARPPARSGMTEWLAINLPDDEDRLLTRAAVKELTGLSIAKLKELEKEDPTYPRKQVFRGTRRVGFWLSDVRGWLRQNACPEPEANPRRRARTRHPSPTT
jgi:predicted DNA-binding transcriptional regulator AlpA